MPVSVILQASALRAVAGANVTLTAMVADASATGTVKFFDGARGLGTVPVAAGAATLTTKALKVGNRPVTARYSGDATHEASTSTGVLVKVAKAKPKTVKVALTKAAKSGKRTAVVTVSKLDNGQRAVGKVKVYVGGKLFKQAKVSAAGKARVKLPASAKRVKATFVPTNRGTVATKSSKTVKVAAR
jgi:hypothetical protein